MDKEEDEALARQTLNSARTSMIPIIRARMEAEGLVPPDLYEPDQFLGDAAAQIYRHAHPIMIPLEKEFAKVRAEVLENNNVTEPVLERAMRSLATLMNGQR